MDTKIKNDIKDVDLEQEQVSYVLSLSKIFMITLFDSYSIFIILSLCCHEKLVVPCLQDDGKDDEENPFNHVKSIHFTTCKLDLTKSPQIIIGDSTIIYFFNHVKASLSLQLISFSTMSKCKHEYNFFQKTFWFCRFPHWALLPIQNALESEDFSASNMISYFINQHLFYCSPSKSYQTFTMFTFMFSDQKYILMHCFMVLPQRCFDFIYEESQVDMFLKSPAYVDKHCFLTDDCVSLNVS